MFFLAKIKKAWNLSKAKTETAREQEQEIKCNSSNPARPETETAAIDFASIAASLKHRFSEFAYSTTA